MSIRKWILGCMIVMAGSTQALAQDAANDDALNPPAITEAEPAITEIEPVESNVTVGMDSALAQANQGFLALYNRQFLMAKQQYEQAASSNPEYQRMVDLCQNILDRMRDLSDEYMEIYGKVMSPNFRMEQLKQEEINRMLDFQLRQNQAGQTLGEMGLIADIPVSDLGLDFEGSEQMTLGEYLMWIKPRSANERIWNRAFRRTLERSLIYAKQEIKQQQRQERFARLQESRRRRLDRQGSGGMGVGGGMSGNFGGM
ncbi:MAG: hypothetical protein JXR73_21365, partial [Candidatus Omnitrophica bacterium]|nr:hypothetical protein [Candidatus Omnitrophota bacterium]